MNRMFSTVTKLCFVATLCFCTSALAATIPPIQGNVYDAASLSGLPNSQVDLYLDDGNALFDGSDTIVGSAMTNGNGDYSFADLDLDGSYFVVHGSDVSALQTPGDIRYTIDNFDITQSVIANPVSGARMDSIAGPTSSILGGHRDLYLQISSGTADGKLRANPFSLNSNLQIDMASGVTGLGVVTWDGILGTTGMVPEHGLNMDFTEGGLYDGVGLRLAVDAAGQGQLLKLLIHSGDKVSEAELEFPVVADVQPTVGSYVPFTSFVGDADITNVTSFQLIIDADMPSLDAQIDVIGLQSESIVDFAVVPEPASASLLIACFLGLLAARRRQLV